eukprot:20321-Hanusia_phi.AAC.3
MFASVGTTTEDQPGYLAFTCSGLRGPPRRLPSQTSHSLLAVTTSLIDAAAMPLHRLAPARRHLPDFAPSPHSPYL